MDSDRLRLCTHLEVPARGQSVRLAVGGSELLLEGARGGHSLLWHAGREARRHVVGLRAGTSIAFELRPPALPIRLLLRETLTLAPGARVRGYVQVPLVPTLCWHKHINLPTLPLLELLPQSLRAEWDDRCGASYGCSSSWFVRYPVHGGEPRATLPLSIHNASDEVCSPDHLPLAIEFEELLERRGGIGAAPRRLLWDGSAWTTVMRTARAAEVPA